MARVTRSSSLAFDADFSRSWAAFGGVAALKRLHALHPARPGDETATTAFALTALARLASARADQQVPRPILWVLSRAMLREAGRPYGPGLSALGIAPERVVMLAASNIEDALAAAEMGLEIGALDGVVMELPPALPTAMLAFGKRLALRAERSATPAFLIHANTVAPPSPVATRWQVASLPARRPKAWAPAEPVAVLTLVKNRFGPPGRWSVPLTAIPQITAGQLHHRGRDAVSSCVPPPHPEFVAPASADRSHPPPRSGHAA